MNCKGQRNSYLVAMLPTPVASKENIKHLLKLVRVATDGAYKLVKVSPKKGRKHESK